MANIPYTKSVSTDNVRMVKEGVRQKPFVEPIELPYVFKEWVRTRAIAWGSFVAPSVATSNNSKGMSYLSTAVFSDSLTANNMSALAYSRAYNKLLSKTGERASLLTAFAERKSTYSMVLNRLTQLYKGASALRKGRFREFLRTFGIKPKNKHKDNRWSRPRDFSGLWLEYWFGWAPTIGDIENAITVWQEPLSSKIGIRVSAGNRRFSESETKDYGWILDQTTVDGSYLLQLRCKIELTNPDLWVANSLGLLNPVRTAWETTPFSWFVDWFTNVGQVLGSFTDQIGVKISDVWSTRFSKGVERQIRTRRPKPTSGYDFEQRFTFMRRMKHPSLPRPAFVVRIPEISWTRALTLSSLLVQLFSPKTTSRA